MNVISVDFAKGGDGDSFGKTLTDVSGSLWKTEYVVSNESKHTVWSELRRYFLYCKQGFSLFRRRKEVENLVSWQQFHGIFFAFFCHLFHVKKTTNLIILTLIYKRKKGIAGWVYEQFMKFALDDRYVDLLVCFSEQEIVQNQKIFNVTNDKYKFLLVAADNIPVFDHEPSADKYIFTAGYSHRDFNFVINALKETEYKLVIADDKVDDPQVENVDVLRGCYGEDMLKVLGKSFVFINPLKDKMISAGHLMAISAMQSHKPIICTDSAGMHPYLVNGETGFFIDNTKKELLEKLDLLYSDQELYRRMCEASYNYGKEQFSWSRLGLDIAKLGKQYNWF